MQIEELILFSLYPDPGCVVLASPIEQTFAFLPFAITQCCENAWRKVNKIRAKW